MFAFRAYRLIAPTCAVRRNRWYTTMNNKPKVFLTRDLNDEALSMLKETCEVTQWKSNEPIPKEEMLKYITDKDALFCLLTDKVDKEVLDAAPKLKVIATMSVGYDHLDVEEITKRQIKIGYTPNILTDATAELTIGLLLATTRRLFEAASEARNGGWKSWSPFWMCGHGLKNSTIGIVGFGAIGQEVAKRLKAFNVKKILFYNRSDRVEEAMRIGACKMPLDCLLAESDFVIATTALTPETALMFNRETFAKMKPTAVFINTSRGGLVDQAALVEALQNNIIWAAGLDVTTPEPLELDNRLFGLKNCVVLPHIGSANIATREGMVRLTCCNILAALKNEPMPAELQVNK